MPRPATPPSPAAPKTNLTTTDLTSVLDVATLLSLDIPADCRAGLLANFELLRGHGLKLEAGLQAAKQRALKTSRRK